MNRTPVAGLVLERREPRLFGGLFETALARKPPPSDPSSDA
jgi:hypothetical protein